MLTQHDIGSVTVFSVGWEELDSPERCLSLCTLVTQARQHKKPLISFQTKKKKAFRPEKLVHDVKLKIWCEDALWHSFRQPHKCSPPWEFDP